MANKKEVNTSSSTGSGGSGSGSNGNDQPPSARSQSDGGNNSNRRPPSGRRTNRHSLRRNRGNSLRFRQVDVDWTPDQDPRNRNNVVVQGAGGQDEVETSEDTSMELEVMDLRPSTHPSVMMMATSSFVSIASAATFESDNLSGMFQVAIEGDGGGLEDSERPEHWVTAGELSEEDRQRRQQQQNQGTSRQGTVERMRRLSNASGNRVNVITTTLGALGRQRERRQEEGGLHSSIGSGSGIWSGASTTNSQGSRTTGSRSSQDSNDSNNSAGAVVDLVWRRRVYFSRIARVAFGVVALAALTASVLYLVLEDDEGGSLFSANAFGGWFSRATDKEFNLERMMSVGDAEYKMRAERNRAIRKAERERMRKEERMREKMEREGPEAWVHIGP